VPQRDRGRTLVRPAGEPTPVILRSPASIRSGNYCFGGADESVLAGGVVGGVAEASGAAGAAL
jgi:hypothetical protein